MIEGAKCELNLRLNCHLGLFSISECNGAFLHLFVSVYVDRI